MKKKMMILCMALFAMLLATAGGFAQYPTTCQTNTQVVKGTGATPLRLAVAANFYGPMQDLIGRPDPITGLFPSSTFLGQANVNNVTVTICSNATGTFAANLTGYDMFFAADDTAEDFNSTPSNCNDLTTCAFLYAKGKPVLFGWPTSSGMPSTITDVSDLIAQLGSNFTGKPSWVVSGPAAGYSIVTPNANQVAIANPSVAPFGAAAMTIMNAMGTNFPPVVLNTQPNVGAAFSAVGTLGTKSGFVAESQICASGVPLSSVVYVEFPYYFTSQYAIQLTVNGGLLNGYIQRQMVTPGTVTTLWDDFLTAHCYVPLN